MSGKSKVITALRAGANGIPISYGYTERAKPYLIFNLIDSRGLRLSDRRHGKSTRWQVDLYNLLPLDTDTDILLTSIQETLEDNRLITTEWIEIAETDAKSEVTTWRYMLEVLVDG